MSETKTLLSCWLIGTPITQAFGVKFEHDDIWDSVKDEIKKKKKPEFDNIDANTLDLWKVTIGDSQRSILKSEVYLKSVMAKAPLDPLAILSTEFNAPVPEDPINIIIVRRPTPNESVPYISPFWSPRSDTVHRLYEILLKEKLVHVRGTPGCGKTTLMNLLHAHIRNQMPSAFVFTHHSWNLKPTESAVVVTQRLQRIDPAFPRQSITFLLFDEGQDSYGDPLFWNAFIKEAGDGIYPFYRVILFCSYGSPTSHPVEYEIGSPQGFRAAARISLWPVGASPGILLQWSEFLEVVSHFEHPLNVHPDLLNLIFIWTVGHVGAVVEVLRLISYLKVSETRHEKQFTVQDFYNENPVHLLVRRLDAGAFERGFPRVFSPDLVALFRRLLKDRKIEMKDGETDVTVVKCHRRGWIYATMIPGGLRYTFPSPLHEACLSWKLEPRNNMPNFPSLFKLSLKVISNFRPSQLQLRHRRVGSVSTLPPEAQYQDEYYNSLLAATFGNVRISPEYASAQVARVAGRIDFFIPIVKWGIEITRDGNRIPEHGARFADSGAYGAWLKSADMDDYILLDFRTKKNPRAQHPTIPNLYHVVFRNEYREVLVYNNLLQLVEGPIALHQN